MLQRWAGRPTVLGVLVFLASDLVFFGLLITAYVYYHGEPTVASMAREHLDPLRTGVFSVFLFSSSLTAWLSERSRRHDRVWRRRLWLIVTMALGALFLVGQGTEYAGLLGSGIGLGTNLFGTAFFTLTGFHAIHVAIGLVLLSIVLAIDLAASANPRGALAHQSVSVYWHFVDWIWLAIFGFVYVLTLYGIL